MIDNQVTRPFWAGRCLVAALALLLAFGCSPAAENANPAEAAPAADPTPAADTEPVAANTTLHNRVRWSTASEVDNFGFDVYRGDSEEGPFTRLTEEPIPGAGTVDEPQQYEWIDTTNDPTRGYYYYVEAISMSNQREPFTPVFFAKPKQPADAG